MVRKERLELSHPKILEPKSSASTNSATPASSIQVFMFWNLNPASYSRQLPIPPLPHYHFELIKEMVVILNSSLSNKKNGG